MEVEGEDQGEEEETRKEEQMEDEEETGKEQKEEEEMEEDKKEKEEEEMETQGEEGDVESSLLDPRPGEKDEEDEEEVEDTREEELLKEEVSQDEVKEVDKEEKGEEKISSEEVITLEEVRDHSDPLNENQKQTLSELQLSSPKETTMADETYSKVNEKCQAQATDLQVTKSNPGSNNNGTKSNPGSTRGHQVESTTNELASNTAKVYEQEEEEVRITSETGKENEKGATGGGEGEVEITGEVMGGSRKERKKDRTEASAKNSGTPGAGQMVRRDTRYEEVKVDTKIQTPPTKNQTIP